MHCTIPWNDIKDTCTHNIHTYIHTYLQIILMERERERELGDHIWYAVREQFEHNLF